MRADENSSLKLSIEKAVFSPFSIFLTVTSPFDDIVVAYDAGKACAQFVGVLHLSLDRASRNVKLRADSVGAQVGAELRRNERRRVADRADIYVASLVAGQLYALRLNDA